MLPFGSYCSFEQDACGWSVSKQPSSWKRIAGDELLERERQHMRGVALYSTPGWQFMHLNQFYLCFMGIDCESGLVRSFMQSPFALEFKKSAECC